MHIEKEEIQQLKNFIENIRKKHQEKLEKKDKEI